MSKLPNHMYPFIHYHPLYQRIYFHGFNQGYIFDLETYWPPYSSNPWTRPSAVCLWIFSRRIASGWKIVFWNMGRFEQLCGTVAIAFVSWNILQLNPLFQPSLTNCFYGQYWGASMHHFKKDANFIINYFVKKKWNQINKKQNRI